MRQLINITLTCTLAFVFLFAGFSKLLDLQGFKAVAGAYHAVPKSMLNNVVYGLPSLELVIGVLLFSRFKPSMLKAYVLLVSVFIGLAFNSLLFYKTKTCGCFGTTISSSSAWNIIFFDSMLLALAIILDKFRSPDLLAKP